MSAYMNIACGSPWPQLVTVSGTHEITHKEMEVNGTTILCDIKNVSWLEQLEIISLYLLQH